MTRLDTAIAEIADVVGEGQDRIDRLRRVALLLCEPGTMRLGRDFPVDDDPPPGLRIGNPAVGRIDVLVVEGDKFDRLHRSPAVSSNAPTTTESSRDSKGGSPTVCRRHNSAPATPRRRPAPAGRAGAAVRP